MADAVIRADAVQAAPAGYKVPAAQEIIVRSVRAVVDGTGAASAFDAVLQLIDPAGNVVWQAPTDSTIAAGGSADVSWFPRVGGGASGPFAQGSDWAIMSHDVAAFADTTAGGTVFVDIPAASLVTSNTTTFAAGVSGGIHGLQFNAVGSYRLGVSASVGAGAAFAAGATLEVSASGAGALNQITDNETSPFLIFPAPGATVVANASQEYLLEIGTGPNPVGTLMRVHAGQSSGVNQDVFFTIFAQALSASIP